ncbi:MAG: hypothetical protein JWM57_1955 [Phycisphaerales bacterium]|nr:hypothetical protein [Phycisphaerales bacterium]
MNAFRMSAFLAAVTLTAGLVTTSQAAAIANFTDGAGATADGFTGAAGNGWSSPWGTASSGVPVQTRSVISDSPLTAGGGNYLSIDLKPNATTPAISNGNVRRTFVKGAAGIDTSQTIDIQFDFRLDSPTSARTNNSDFVTFLDNGDINTGANQTWSITSTGTTGHWSFNNGTRDGVAPAGIDSGITVVTGIVYHFDVVLHDGPTAALTTWDGTISYTDETGPHSATQTNLAYRSAAIVPSGTFQLYAGAALGKQVTYSFDSLNVTNTPEPAVLGLVGMAGFLLRRRVR